MPRKVHEIVFEEHWDFFEPREIRLLMFIINMTIGSNKKSTQYNPKKIMEKLKLPKQSFYESIKKLKEKNVISVEKVDGVDKEPWGNKNGIYTKNKIVLNLDCYKWAFNGLTVEEYEREETLQSLNNEDS